MSHELYDQYREMYAGWLATERLYEAFARRRGLSYSALLVLYSVAREEGPCGLRRICEAWYLPKQTVHSVLQSFTRKGYLTSESDPGDRRNKLLRLTPEGRDFAEKVVSELEAVELVALERMAPEDRGAMVRHNRAYCALLAEAMGEAP